MSNNVIKRILAIVVFLTAFGVSARATEITIPSFTVPNYTRTNAPRVRVYYSAMFTASDGTVVAGGSPGSGTVYKVVTTTLLAGTVTIPTFTIQSTRDGIDYKTSRVSFYLYDGNSPISPNPFSPYASLSIPASIASASGCSPSGTCASLAELKNY